MIHPKLFLEVLWPRGCDRRNRPRTGKSSELPWHCIPPEQAMAGTHRPRSHETRGRGNKQKDPCRETREVLPSRFAYRDKHWAKRKTNPTLEWTEVQGQARHWRPHQPGYLNKLYSLPTCGLPQCLVREAAGHDPRAHRPAP